MKTIHKIYSNRVGISFFWKTESHIAKSRVQLVFRDIGFLLTVSQLKDFSDSCNATIQSQSYSEHNASQHCRSLLLRTPSDIVDLAVNWDELYHIQELINKTIFRVELKDWINGIHPN